jgi:uncharacterized protein with GYD domain
VPKYLFTGTFTQEGAKGLLDEGGSGRRTAVEKLFASLGGTLESYHFAFGSDDFFIIGDLPDSAAAASAALVTSGSGAVHTRTVVLLTAEELDAVARLSPTYRAPGR